MKKIYLSLFIVVVGLSGALFAQDSKLFVTRVDVQGASKSLEITGYNGTGKTVVIPASIDGIPVRKIGNGAFKLKGLTEVIIPNGIEVIGDQAFFGNRLEMVTIPLSVKVISDSAFDSNLLRMATNGDVPAAAEKSGTVFTPSRNVAVSVQPRVKIYYIAVDKLRRGQITQNGKVVNYDDFYNPLAGFDGGYKPVYNSRTVPVLVKDTSAKAQPPVFPMTAAPVSKTSVRIPALTTATNSGTADTSVKKKAWPQPTGAGKGTVPKPGMPEARGVYYVEKPLNNIIETQPNKNGSYGGGIGSYAYKGQNLDFIVIPEGTTYIGVAAFYSNNLTAVTIPNSVRVIGSQAFMGNNLASITIGENVTVQYDSFRYQFSDYYRMNGFKAGTYILKAGHWNYEGNEKSYIPIDVR
ncbi:MAG: leucine-rich repeat domain-containing protein [Spirochaetaceae bacterium]|nr:leucine-rich repeat domain-containing protein [Spirochaetaceae bacterium]